MDILPLPHSPTSPTENVPYVCTERYDGRAFLTYPARKGRPEMVSPTFPPGAEFGMHEKANPSPVRELESLYQTWLYFGLLCEFLNINEDSPGTPPPDANSSREAGLEAVYKFFTDSSEGGDKFLQSSPILWPELELWKWEGDEETRKIRCRHLFECLRITHWMLQWIPEHFDSRVRFAIAVLAEYLNFNLGTMIVTAGWKDVKVFYGPWAIKFLTTKVQQQMREAGWCPSAIEGSRSRHKGLQTLNMISKMDKSKPARDHSRCTTQLCQNYQIDIGNYKLIHAVEECGCSEIEVDSDAITEISMKDESSIPLLKVIPGDDLGGLRIELVLSSPTTPYVALSHVWADGLGNPLTNSLYRCQVARVKSLIDQLDTSTTPDNPKSEPAPLLWLDTLCCPVKDGIGKQTAIQKIRQVYQNAAKVLVLDASLFSIDSSSLHVSEVVVRAYTSPWMRRLWTLQEGALAKHLYFQFLDRAVHAQGIMDELKSVAWNRDARYIHPFFDMDKENSSIRSFFQFSANAPESPPHRRLETLESALQNRSCSVSSDEPLCIATLMSLDIAKVLDVQGAHPRMKAIWGMLAKKLGGIPASIVFYEDRCLTFPGWRWAPRSFLLSAGTQFDLDKRRSRWVALRTGPQLGLPTPYGLKCQFPGFLVKSNVAGQPDPFKEIWRPTETSVMFQDEKGTWYSISQSSTPSILAPDFYEQMAENRIKYGWPLSDTVQDGGCAIVLEEDMTQNNGQKRDAYRGILVKINGSVDSESGIKVERKAHVVVATQYKQEALVQETYKKLWLQMREDELTRKLAEIPDHKDERYLEVLDKVKKKMDKVMKDALSADSELLAGIPRVYGQNFDINALWIRLANWFEQDNTGVKLPADQVWYVD